MFFGSVIVWGTALVVNADSELKKHLGISDDYHVLASIVLGKSDTVLNEKEMELTIKVDRI